MLFYEITLQRDLEQDLEREDFVEKCIRARNLNAVTEQYYSSHRNTYIFAGSMSDTKIMMGAVCMKRLTKQAVYGFLKMTDFEYIKVELKEITFDSMRKMLSIAERNDYIDDCDFIWEEFNLTPLIRRRFYPFGEWIFNPIGSKNAIMKEADRLMSPSLKEELERIFAVTAKPGRGGHPVHYMVETDSTVVFKEIIRVLFSALIYAGRIHSRRFSVVEQNNICEFSLAGLYHAAEGGVVCIDCNGSESSDNSDLLGNGEKAYFSDVFHRFRNDTLTVIRLPQNSEKQKKTILHQLGRTAWITLTDKITDAIQIRNYLTAKAKERKVCVNDSLYAIADKPEYTLSELNCLFEKWMEGYLTTYAYPQYAEVSHNAAEVHAEKRSAYDELSGMIGLENVKAVIDEALAYYKIQKAFGEHDLSMHMVFTGNPGTAKTTVARLFAEIMKENGVLSTGEMHEVGRADLVGKYVGWTAQIVKEKFREAKGGVLFIDEAYSLVDDRSGMFGDEAISTIVQEMENNREDTIVIFAGYPKEMGQFLSRNPGLRSRIAYHIHFEDYSAEELYEITEWIAHGKGAELSSDVKNVLIPYFTEVRTQSGFGNGRFARNLVEKALRRRAVRLLSEGEELSDRKELLTLSVVDFDLSEPVKNKRCSIGF